MTGVVALGALRGAAAGAAAVGVVVAVLLAAHERLRNLGDGMEGLESLFEVIVVLTLLPSAVLVVGLGVAYAVRLRGWWAVGLVAPVLSLVAIGPLPEWPALRAAVAVAVYAAAGATSTAVAERR